MLIKLQQHNGMPVWVNPRFVRSVRALNDNAAEICLPEDTAYTVTGNPEDIAVQIARHQGA